jgi:GDP-4-dehydro-6-deoxy-D-mannose reductase
MSRSDIEVFGVSLPTDSTRNVQHLLPRIGLYTADLNDYRRVRELLQLIEPEYLFHLAAQASVERSWDHPAETLVNNVTVQANLLQAVVELGLKPRILVVGSADEYGLVQAEDLPVDEDTPLRPLNPYAVSKIAQDFLGYQYHLSHGLHIVRVRPFNHIGPRQGLGFVVPDFARQIARIEAGLQEPVLRVGNLAASRDISDVRDIVRGYYLALAQGRPGEVYNLGSSRSFTIAEILQSLLALSRITVRIEPDDQRMRPSDIPIMVCDSRRFIAEVGWEPEYALEQSLADVLGYWRQRVSAAGESA